MGRGKPEQVTKKKTVIRFYLLGSLNMNYYMFDAGHSKNKRGYWVMYYFLCALSLSFFSFFLPIQAQAKVDDPLNLISIKTTSETIQ